jgi:aminomethyltransferase
MTRLGYTAELGFELWVDDARAVELWDALVAVGGRHGMAVIGMVALDLFRIEGGFIIGGVEYDATVSPYECGLGWSVDLDKGPFQGRDGCLRDRDATTLRLTSVVLDGGGEAASGAALSIDGTQAGFVTQAVVSPYLAGRTLGLAKVRRDLIVPGTPVVARVDGEAVAGSLVEHPVYERGRRKAKELAAPAG